MIIMILSEHWCNQYPSQLDPGVEISHDILTPHSNNRWQSILCISYLLDNIYHYIHDIKIISMISWIVIMLLLTLPNAIPTRPGGQNIIWYFHPPSKYFAPPPQKKNILMISWVVIMLFILTLPKAIPTWPGGQIIVWYFDPPLDILTLLK